MTRVLVTGGGGFVGQWLARELLARGDAVTLAGMGPQPEGKTILSSAQWARVVWRQCDVRQLDEVSTVVRASDPEQLYHLAGISLISAAEKSPETARAVNVVGAINVANTLAALSRPADRVMIVVGSGAQYGAHPAEEMPLEERAEQRPLSVYAQTKKAQEDATLQIGRRSGLRIVCTRSFNHSGPGQDASFLLPSLVQRLRASHGRGIIPMGNDSVRDYLHVQDVAAAYIALADRGRAGETYNVSSGEGVGTYALASELIELAGAEARVGRDKTLERPADIPILVGNPAKLRRDTGWQPRRNRREMLLDLLAAT